MATISGQRSRVARRPGRLIAALAGIWGAALLAFVGAQSDGPRFATNPNVHRTGDTTRGRDVFRFETFGNERFWTDAVRLPAGALAAGVTPLRALQLGLHVDSDALPAALAASLTAELRTNLTPASAPLLNSVSTTVALLNANAVIGLPAKDSNGDGRIDILSGDKVGASCALCHTITDGSVYSSAAGTIGRRLDGRANHVLNFGSLVAAGTNSLAYYPVLQLALTANGGATLGLAPTGLTENSTEADADAYLSNPRFYPIGTFDDSVDGNGDPMHNSALFRTDLAAPWGTEGGIQFLDNFSNLVYTALLDPTNLTTTGGRAFLRTFGGAAAGAEIADDYVQVLTRTRVTGYPYVQASPHPQPGTEAAPLGVRVDDAKLVDMNAYLNSLPAPVGVTDNNQGAIARGRERFRINCTFCHNVDQRVFVPPAIVPMRNIFPGDSPRVLLPERVAPFNPILDTPGNPFDDKMAVVNASQRGLQRGTALPLLLDLARKPNLLHDSSVPSLDALLDPGRGSMAPHPFYLRDTGQRGDVVAFLRSLDTSAGSGR